LEFREYAYLKLDYDSGSVFIDERRRYLEVIYLGVLRMANAQHARTLKQRLLGVLTGRE
jgi:hypothetical protein